MSKFEDTIKEMESQIDDLEKDLAAKAKQLDEANKERTQSLVGKTEGVVKSSLEKIKGIINDTSEKRGIKDRLQGTANSAKNAFKDVDTSKIKDIFKKKEEIKYKHNVVELNDSSIRILLPEGYEKLKYKNPIAGAIKGIKNNEVAYRKTIGNSDNVVMISKGNVEAAMNPDDLKGLIDGIHEALSDNQGIIEVKNGETKRGYKYIYSIVKNLSEVQFGGVRYFVRLNLFNGPDIVEVQADFTEIGTTGSREALCVEFARRAGLTDITSEGLKNWTEDPYNPDFKKGCLKNLAEKEGLDGLFPENPLSQAHEFLLSVLNDEYVTVRQDDESEEEKEESKELTEEEKAAKKEEEKEFFLELFVDRNRRYTYPVDIDELEQTEEKTEHKPSKKQDDSTDFEEVQALSIQAISTRNAIKIFYYLMAADGQIYHNEEEKFDLIAKELDPNFVSNKEKIVLECKAQLDKVIDPEDYYSVLQEGIEDALLSSRTTADTFITPKLLLWDLLTLAYSDEQYDEPERKLIKYIMRKTNVDKAVFLEMESSILTLIDIENELTWIKTTNKPYLTIEAMVNELADRKNAIFESVKDLIAL